VRFAPEYVSCVLEENFEDAKAQFLSPLMAIHFAHLVMLTTQGIVSREDARAIRAALEGIDIEEVRRARYDGSVEDLFFYLDRQIADRCGEETAGRLHLARSRNDIDMAMYRMGQRGMVLALVEGAGALRRVLLDLAGRHVHDVYAAHTHTQLAQPSTIAHYLLAVVEQLERDVVRLRAAYASTNVSPLGACAITGTGFPIDRRLTAALLGFDGTTGNTYGSIATVDYLLESVSAAAVLTAGLGRVAQDLLLWCTSEFGYLRLADGLVQSSSIMPQKRNPVALEHARALASKALGQASAIVLAVHNTPFGDIVDTEDDLQPLVASMFRDAARGVRLLVATLGGASFDTARMAARAAEGWITVTELSDTLVREHGVPPKAAYRIAARLTSAGPAHQAVPLAAAVRGIAQEEIGRPLDLDDEALARILSPQHFVAVRTTYGGPAPSRTTAAIAASAGALEADAGWLERARTRLRDAQAGLETAVAAL
jgi:argininosuccinate lyase